MVMQRRDLDLEIKEQEGKLQRLRKLQELTTELKQLRQNMTLGEVQTLLGAAPVPILLTFRMFSDGSYVVSQGPDTPTVADGNISNVGKTP